MSIAMDETHLSLISLVSLVSLIIVLKLVTHRKGRNPPPSPLSLPIIGHLHLLVGPVHRVFHQLCSKYGPIMGLRFGSRPVLVVASPSAVEECFTKHDILLANRPLLLSTKYLEYDNTTLGAAPYGRLWRDLRRIATLELFSTTRLKSFMGIRQDEVKALLKDLSQDAWQDFTRAEMRPKIEALSFNIIMRIVCDKRFYGAEVDDLEEANKFREIIAEIVELSAPSNLGDFIPLLQWIDFRGYEKRLATLQTESDIFSQKLIEERRTKRQHHEGKAKTLIDAMLSLQDSEPEYYTDEMIKGIILTLLIAGTDTLSVTTEWGMSVLLNHPDVIKRARREIDEYIGEDVRLLEEPDIFNHLPFMECILHETLRLFPTTPLLVPHEPSEDFTIGGFNVSQGTMVLVNAWAIHRDPQVWEDPSSFKPERFEKAEDFGFNFIPFGTGRRQCPGNGLAHRVVMLALASLIQCFEWERVGEELVDLREGKGLTLHKHLPLEAKCKVRQRMSRVVKEL